MKAIATLWFNESTGCIGLVAAENSEKEIKFLIGIGKGNEEFEDSQHIADWGGKVEPERIISFIREMSKKQMPGEVNWQVEIMNMFRQFKLGNSLFRDYHRITRQKLKYWKDSAIDHKRRMIGEIRQRLADFILHHQESATKETELENGELEIRTELLVLKMDEFKAIVEAAIVLIPDDKIQKIKAGKAI